MYAQTLPALVHFKARVAVLILGDGGSPNHGDGFQIALAIGLRKDGKTQDPAFTWCERKLSFAGIGRWPPESLKTLF